VNAIVAIRGLGAVPLDSNEPPPPGPLQAAILANRTDLLSRGYEEAREHGFHVYAQRVDADMTALSVTEPDGIPEDLMALHMEGKLHSIIYVFEDRG